MLTRILLLGTCLLMNCLLVNTALATPALTTAELSELGLAGLTRHWQPVVKTGQFKANDGLMLPYAKLVKASHQKAIIVVNGRTETYLKYRELALDLFNNGYNVYLYDHRGQGLAPRLVPNPEMGYVAKFDDYVQDLEQFVQQVVLSDAPAPLYLVGHSMGGTIAALWLSQTQVRLQAAALSSPMIGIYLKPLPRWLVDSLLSVLHTGCKWRGQSACYAPGQGDYQAQPFKDNVLTHSEERYRLMIELYQEEPKVRLGGASIHWLQLALEAGEQAIQQAGRITTPLLVLQASQDRVVDNAAQARFCQALPSCYGGQPKVIKKANHELFIERDNQRRQALETIFSFFEQHPAASAKP